MNDYIDDYTPYKKRSKKKPPTKAKHKHEFVDCIFEHDRLRLDDAHGFQPYATEDFGTYCRICGKIGGIEYTKWVCEGSQDTLYVDTIGVSRNYTAEALRQLDINTRTLPTFRVDDFFKQKYVELIDKGDD